MPRRREARLDFAGHGGVQGGKDVAGRTAFRPRVLDRQRREARGQGRLEMPAHGFAIAQAAGALGGREPNRLEPGMGIEQAQQPLPDYARGAEYSDRDPFLHGRVPCPRYEPWLRVPIVCFSKDALILIVPSFFSWS